MESPEDERLAIEAYLHSQSGDAFDIEHVEKLTSEYVLGRQYDVWDAHTNEGRWWVITNPTNLYSQDAIKSMDVALSFHIGIMHRVMARQPDRRSGTAEDWILDVLRRVDLAQERLDTAKEVEDFQSVGVRLREALVSLATILGDLTKGHYDEEPPKAADFKGWAHLTAGVIAAGGDRAHLRGLLKATSEKTWAYVNWLTHARRATPLDARIGCGAVSEVIDLFITAISQWRMGAPPRCRACGSYQLKLDFDTDESWFTTCRTCGCRSTAEPLALIGGERVEEERSGAAAEGGAQEAKCVVDTDDCVVVEDFGIYLSPKNARALMEEMQDRVAEDGDTPWANFFTVEDSGVLADAHRVVFTKVRGAPSSAVELVYRCPESDVCVNPEHATELPLPRGLTWAPAIIRTATIRPSQIELDVDLATGESRQLFVTPDIFDTLTLPDLSALPERIVMVAEPGSDGWAAVVLAEKRSSFRRPSIGKGWLRPSVTPEMSAECPCTSGKAYEECHGAT